MKFSQNPVNLWKIERKLKEELKNAKVDNRSEDSAVPVVRLTSNRNKAALPGSALTNDRNSVRQISVENVFFYFLSKFGPDRTTFLVGALIDVHRAFWGNKN